MYQYLIKPILFHFDPERVHDFFVRFGELLGSFFIGRWIVGLICRYDHPALHTTVLGMHLTNPIGLGAGFDKDMRLTRIMPSVGFGFMEVGSVTYHSYDGNPGLRLVRPPEDQSLIVYYGLKSAGAHAIAKKIDHHSFAIPVGINIAKTNRADISGPRSVEDYLATYRMLAEYFSYVTLNISCPNTQDGCTFQDPTLLNTLLAAISREPKTRPILLKISNHLGEDGVDSILNVVAKYPCVDGFVVSNLSKRRENLNLKSSPERLALISVGGISGKPIRDLSTRMIRHIYQKTKGKYVLIGLGGIFTAEDAYEKIRAGASLVQLVTGLIYGGPATIKRINQGLVQLLKRDGFSHIGQAVGTETVANVLHT